MKTLNETIKDNEEILIEYFKKISLEKDIHIRKITIETMGRDIVCNIYCDFSEDPDIDKLFDNLNEEQEWNLYNQFKDRKQQQYRIDWKEALDIIRVEGRDKKIDEIIN